MINLRHVLQEFCTDIHDISRIVFMSDRNQGLLNTLQVQFPECLNLFCTQHLSSNLRGHANLHYFWEAVEAVNEAQFNDFCRQGGPALEELKESYFQWSRFGIAERGCRRYAVRTNNAAESLNNAFTRIRFRPLLHILHVALDSGGVMTCSCLRYFDEEVALPAHAACYSENWACC